VMWEEGHREVPPYPDFGRHCPGFSVYRDLYRGLASPG